MNTTTNVPAAVQESLNAYLARRGYEAVSPIREVNIYWRVSIKGPKGTNTVWAGTYGDRAPGRWHLNAWVDDAFRAHRREVDAARRVRRAALKVRADADHTIGLCYKAAINHPAEDRETERIEAHSGCQEAHNYVEQMLSVCPADVMGHRSDGDGHCQNCGKAL